MNSSLDEQSGFPKFSASGIFASVGSFGIGHQTGRWNWVEILRSDRRRRWGVTEGFEFALPAFLASLSKGAK